MRILNTHRSDKHTHIHLLGTSEGARFVAKVTDRYSAILDRPVQETIVYRTVGEVSRGSSSVQRNYHRACLCDPVLVLPVASIEKAMEELS